MTFSFEVFPPKTQAGMANLREAIDHYYAFKPDFISCTYRPGGANADRHFEVCRLLKAEAQTEVMPHFTSIGNTREQIAATIREYESLRIENILAMRGDLPPGWEGTEGDFNHADGLIRYIKDQFPDFCIAAACYPEKHMEAPSFAADVAHLRRKQDNGAEFLMPQLCHDVDAFKAFADRMVGAGITIPVVMGIMPALNKDALIRMTLSNGCSIPAELAAIIGRHGEDPDEFRKAGIEYTVKQIFRYMEAGVAGVHLYTLNKSEDVDTIIRESGIRRDL